MSDVSDKSPRRTDAFVRSSEIRHDIDERTKASILQFRPIATFVGNVMIAVASLWGFPFAVFTTNAIGSKAKSCC